MGNFTVFARYVEPAFATQVILSARLTRLYEREDWKVRFAATEQDEPVWSKQALIGTHSSTLATWSQYRLLRKPLPRPEQRRQFKQRFADLFAEYQAS
jgi:hypothetical protein